MVIRCAFVLAFLGMSVGCSMLPLRPFIKTAGVKVTAPVDAGTPAQVTTDEVSAKVQLAKGSVVKVTKTSGIPATESKPEVPATEVTEIIPSEDTTYVVTSNRTDASTGTIDTTVAVRKIEAVESRPLLYAAIACVLGAGFFVWAKYPTPALACGIGSAVFFMSWKMTGLPDWFWVVGTVALAIAVALYLGHERGEKIASK